MEANSIIFIKIQSVPCSKHSVSSMKKSHLIFYREIPAIFLISLQNMSLYTVAERSILLKLNFML